MATHPAPDVWEVQGRQIDLPVKIESASFAGALWRPSRTAVDAQLEQYGLRSAGFRDGGLALLMLVVYREFVLGTYDEVGLAVLASGPGGPGMFTLELPVTQGFTREAGREIWGLPKWLMTSRAHVGGARSTLSMSDGDVAVMDATIQTGHRPLPIPVPLITPTLARAEDGPHAGRLLRGKALMRGHRVRIGRGRGTTFGWGEHPMADRARALGMDRPPFATISAERLTGSLGESRAVDG
ncbi:acetoacetate decarboxylase family protein [Aeromicrobium sp.]|uniref:acetoacetate decarboxylase family protein n=1 Tax=Aeromicrobium sp. TaxID=1871063 RepID=UPI003D6A8C21